jgi:hypothetical protein
MESVLRRATYVSSLICAFILSVTGAEAATQGLLGAYYDFSSGPTSVAQAEAMISKFGKPTATFIDDTVCFPTRNATALVDKIKRLSPASF